MALGGAVAAAIIPALLSLFGTGALAGAAVTAAGWVVDKIVTMVFPALVAVVQSAGLVAAALLLAGLLLGAAGLIMNLLDAMACSLVEGYRCARPAHRRGAA